MSFNQPSKGEKKVMDILKQHRISYKREVSFLDLHGQKNSLLRYDIGIYRNNKLFALIEIDGAQHFKFVKHFHKTPLGFMKSREWDRRKNSYCLLHNIPLIRIPYWDLDTLTFEKIFSTKEYIVKTKYHNDILINRGVK